MSCLPEWNLLKWIRREIKIILKHWHCKPNTPSARVTKFLNDIIATMNENFDDWPEDPK